MKLKMEILPNSYEEDKEDCNFPFCWGKIFISDDFWESITPALNYWTIEDYERQWKAAIERIKTHDTSCLVSSVQNPHISNPFIDWWVMYKQGNKIVIHNQLLVSEAYGIWVGDNEFTPDNCYQFIKPIGFSYLPEEDDIVDEDDHFANLQPSEWVVYLDEIEHQA